LNTSNLGDSFVITELQDDIRVDIGTVRTAKTQNVLGQTPGPVGNIGELAHSLNGVENQIFRAVDQACSTTLAFIINTAFVAYRKPTVKSRALIVTGRSFCQLKAAEAVLMADFPFFKKEKLTQLGPAFAVDALHHETGLALTVEDQAIGTQFVGQLSILALVVLVTLVRVAYVVGELAPFAFGHRSTQREMDHTFNPNRQFLLFRQSTGIHRNLTQAKKDI
jgi:hypothetical protein